MKKTLFLIVLVFLIGLGTYFYAFKKPDTYVILLKKGSYEPPSLSIPKDTVVIFKNDDNKPHWPASDFHPTHGIYPSFDPRKPVEPGGSWSFTFDKLGKWKYHDHLSPEIKGFIEVK